MELENENVDFLIGRTVQQIWIWGPFRDGFDGEYEVDRVPVRRLRELARGRNGGHP
jgi:hypothetical protein